MICLTDSVVITPDFFKIMESLSIEVSSLNYVDGVLIKVKPCFTLPGLDKYLPLLTPLIIKVVAALLLFLVLHLFYNLIPDRM